MLELPGNDAQSEGVLLHEHEYLDTTEGLNKTRKWAVEKNKRLTDEFVAKTLENEGITEPGEPVIIKETEWFLCYQDGSPVNPPVPGHTDEVRWYPQCGILFIFDSKFGRLPVANAALNGQLRVYFVMVQDHIGAKKVFCAIRQPFLKAPLDFHSTYYEAADLEVARKEILDTIEACNQPDAPRVVSPEACTYCRAKGTARCLESMKAIEDINRYRVISMDPRKMELLADHIKGAKVIIKGWEERLKQIATMYPALLTRHYLGKQSYNSVVQDPAKAFEVLYRMGHFGDDQYEGLKTFINSCCDVSVPKLAEYLENQSQAISDGRQLLSTTLGEQIEGDEDNGALILMKPKERSLLKKQANGRNY